MATVIQRGDTPTSREFFMVHEELDIGKGGFVQLQNDGTVIGRIAEVYKANEYFEDAESVSEMDVRQKFPVDDWEVSIAKVSIMGKFKEDMIRRVTKSPRPGTSVKKAKSELVREFLGLDENGLELGEVQQQNLAASFDMTDTLQKHFAVLAQSGAGKSYSTSVMLEELLDRQKSPAIVAVDPHGDYTCFAEDENYMDRTKVFRDQNISIAVKDLSADQIAGFFNGMSGPQREELNEVLRNLQRGENKDFNLEDVENRLERKEMNDKVKYALMRKLRKLQGMNIFGRSNSPSKKDVEPGKLNIIDLSETIDHQKKQIIAAFFTNQFFKKRRQGNIPPVLMLFEEAHNFAQNSAPSPSRSIIEKIAREGRKFHCSLGLISQRPVKLSTTALSQCNTQFILRVTNPNDLEHIAQSSEGITSEVKAQIPGLKTGEGIVIGEAVNYPTFIDVRTRKSKESSSGEGLEHALEEWREEEEQKSDDAEAFM
ncbi:MAG: ATP-binding protein [Nanohaloarchaea archaeon]|nr:ATP-binding protein [Candidatus Nanohaloarchaea archaeon]